MRAVLDTNILIDILQRREIFFDSSYAVLKRSTEGELDCYICASAITDIYYIIKKSSNDATARDAILRISELVNIVDTLSADIIQALTFNMHDFEDAVVASTAKRIKADYIITRNAKDYVSSPVPAIMPEAFLDVL